MLTATAAHAELTGPCTGTGTINGTVTYNPKIQDSVVIRVRAKSTGEAPSRGSGKRDIDGKVDLKLPWPINEITLNGSWDGPSSRYANSGVYTYDLPAVLVGPKFTVFGHHAERGTVVCTGTIDVRISGSKWKNPALIASLLFTVLAVINLSMVIRVKGRAI